MPPKKPNQPSNKNVQKAKAKAVEDKTFGMKNKNKSKKVEKFIKGLQASAKGPQKDKMQTFEDKKKKEEEAERKKLEQALLKPVVQPKVPVGVDPKSIVCEFFKMGSCTKGNKCKYSHNLEQARKSEKIDIYTDKRNAEDGKPEESMESWDQAKLEKVIETKRGEENKNLNLKTTIVCKYFLEAIEKKKYGWFWECPNGGDKCQYLHCLPPGFQLKIKEEKKEDEEDETPLEDILEEERNKLTTRTPLNLEIFLKWKEEKKKEREIKRAEEQKQKESDIKSGKSMRSGRDLFVFNPDLFVDDDNVIAVEEFEPEQKDDTPVINIEVTGTSIRTTVINKGKEEASLEQVHIKDGGEGKEEDHNSDEEFVPEDVASDSEGEGVEVEEELFNEDEVPDVEDVDE